VSRVLSDSPTQHRVRRCPHCGRDLVLQDVDLLDGVLILACWDCPKPGDSRAFRVQMRDDERRQFEEAEASAERTFHPRRLRIRKSNTKASILTT